MNNLNFAQYINTLKKPHGMNINDTIFRSTYYHEVLEWEELGLVNVDHNGLENGDIKFTLTKSGEMFMDMDKL